MVKSKQKTVFICRECAHSESKWLGRCPQCSAWNAFDEQLSPSKQSLSSQSNAFMPHSGGHSIPLASLPTLEEGRWNTGMSEVNQVLGGGLIRGATVLIGGEPGIGKSTLLLQLAAKIQTKGRILYVSGEESASQIKLRADRLGSIRSELELLIETHVPTILHVCEKLKPVLLIIDSIQTLFNPEAGELPGTINQLKYACHELLSWAKEHECAVFLVAHMTKGGQIAGPKLVEHIVDTVLYFDQTSGDIRVLRAVKNRFGSVDEVGLFTMDERGLSEVVSPEALFLIQREGELPSGIAVAPLFEGSRALLVEIQALTVPAKGGISRIFSDRIDSGRVSRIAAVIEKHVGIRFSDQDIYINVAGGIRIADPGADLPLALVLYSARTGRSLPQNLVGTGELSLAGEVRPTNHLRRRIKACGDLGFTSVITPQARLAHDKANEKDNKITEIPVKRLQEAIKAIWADKPNEKKE